MDNSARWAAELERIEGVLSLLARHPGWIFTEEDARGRDADITAAAKAQLRARRAYYRERLYEERAALH